MKYLIASLLVSILLQQVGDLLDVDSVIERRCITDLSFVRRHFALQALNEMPNCHT